MKKIILIVYVVALVLLNPIKTGNELPAPIDNGDGTYTVFEYVEEDGWIYLDSFTVIID